jgi:mono/diheme cytochrome c family protein
MKMKLKILFTALVAFIAIGAALAGQEEEPDSSAAPADIEDPAGKIDMKVREIFGTSCATSGCHGGRSPKMGLSLEADDVPGNMIGVASGQNSELALIDKEDPSRSYLLIKLTGGEGMKGKKMPIMKRPLKEEEIAAVKAWVEGIAADAEEKPDEGATEEEDTDEDERDDG